MSGCRELAITVSLAVGLVCVGASDLARADEPWPMGTLNPPTPAPLPTVSAPATSPAAPAILPAAASTAPSKPAALIPPAVQQSAGATLDRLVAPIALYPDPLLGQVLMASTYAREVTEAAQWIRIPANHALNGDALISALRTEGWNPSVMALVPFPGLLTIMADKLDWTEQLGTAFRARQGEVMAAVQHLRHAALAAGNLKATPECHCVIQTRDDVISIQPSEGDLVSIPVYKTAVVFGTWAEAASPPAEFPVPPGLAFTPGNVVGFNPGIEVALFGPIWGWGSIDWPNSRIVVDEARYARLQPGHAAFAGGTWVHEAEALPRKGAHNTLAVATRRSHHTRITTSKRFALTHSPPPPPYGWDPRYPGWGPPPGAILPPPPPRHIARNWYDGYYYYDPYR